MKKIIDAMFVELQNAPLPMRPSKFWDELNATNIAQLEQHGIENLRNTVACNYFTFMGDRVQFRFLKAHLSKTTNLVNKLRARLALKSRSINRALKNLSLPKEFMRVHTYYTHMLFDYVKRKDTKNLLNHLQESYFGNPPPVYRGGKLITADLANSILEYYAMAPAIDSSDLKSVMELGAGYGRNAAVFLQLHSSIQYIIADIPPALYVAQEYLTKRFPERKIFTFRPFQSFEEIREEWEQSTCCFLLPHQMKLLPPKSVDLFLNISSLHEMRLDQITYYFAEIDRLVRGYFYFKQWKKSHLPQDGVTICQDDYPIFSHWKKIYSRTCEVQTAFFEGLYFTKKDEV